MGTPTFALPALDALAAAGHELVAVYTQPPRPAGRGKSPFSSPIQHRAEDLGVPVRTPVNFKAEEDRGAFAALDLDVAIVAAYGLILPQAILDAPRMGCLNIHASLLPRWRGAAPIQRAILAGDMETGVTIMQMERGLDTGPMLSVVRTPIGRKTAGDLTDELSRFGADLLVTALRSLPKAVPQPDGSTYAPKIDKAEARLDFTQSAESVERAIRAFNPSPGAFVELQGARVKILAADIVDMSGAPGEVVDSSLTIACADRAIRPLLVQRAGRPAMTTDAALRGWAIPVGTRL